jgi:hypothetical protein
MSMFLVLPLRHRVALAVVLFLVSFVGGAWASTHVGDPYPTAWGVAAGVLTGLGLAVWLLRRGGSVTA